MLSVLGTNLYLLFQLIVGVDGEAAARLAAMTAVDYVRRIVFGVLALSAAISLFFLRKLAIHLFFLMLVLSIALAFYSWVVGRLDLHLLLSGILSILCMYSALLWYSIRLSRKGVLR